MRTAGPHEASLRIVDASAGAGKGAGHEAGLKSGAVVLLEVRGRIGPDPRPEAAGAQLYRISLRPDAEGPARGPRFFVASSAQLLEPGATLKASVERAGDVILLRLLGAEASSPESPRPSPAALLAGSGLPADAAALSALTAILREGIAADPKALARVRRVALREDGERTELAARMEAKGIPAEGEALDGLAREWRASLSDPGAGGGGSGGGAGGGSGSRGDAPAGAWTGFEDLGHDIAREVPEAELPKALASLFRAMVARVADDLSMSAGAEGKTLALFNHLRGPEGSWVLVPFRFALDAVDFSGGFRIQLPYVRGGAGLFEARFTASRGGIGDEWAVYLNFGAGRASTLRIEAPSTRDIAFPAQRLDGFAAQLAALRCSLRREARSEGRGSVGDGLDLDA